MIEESVRGYKMGDSTIRPARVKVAKASKKTSQVKEEKKQNKNNHLITKEILTMSQNQKKKENYWD